MGHTIFVVMQTELTKYHEKVQEMGRGHGLGPPGLHCFLALLKMVSRRDVGELTRSVLVEAYARYQPMEVHELQIFVGMCQLSRMYDETHMRLTLFLAETPVGVALQRGIMELGGVPLVGPAPKGGLERGVQDNVDG